MNATMKKFGSPGTLIRDYDKWVVLLRPGQVTIGALVLVCKEEATGFSMLSRDAFSELHTIISDIEGVLKKTFDYDRINYLMLMMVDPDVHFHVLPRYREPKNFAGGEFIDPGWPGPPDLSQTNATEQEVIESLLQLLRQNWP